MRVCSGRSRCSAPEGSILNARFPAPVRARSMTSFHLHSAIFGALVETMPDRVQAGAGSFWFMSCNGEDEQGRSVLRCMCCPMAGPVH